MQEREAEGFRVQKAREETYFKLQERKGRHHCQNERCDLKEISNSKFCVTGP